MLSDVAVAILATYTAGNSRPPDLPALGFTMRHIALVGAPPYTTPSTYFPRFLLREGTLASARARPAPRTFYLNAGADYAFRLRAARPASRRRLNFNSLLTGLGFVRFSFGAGGTHGAQLSTFRLASFFLSVFRASSPRARGREASHLRRPVFRSRPPCSQ